MTVESFARAFRYRKGSILAPWKNVSRDPEPQGDCQDFAWSVLHIETGGKPWRHILTGRAMLWRSKSPVNGFLPRHAVLWVKGRGWIDSTDRFWRYSPKPHKRAWPVGAPVLVGMAMAAKAWGLW